MSYITLESGKFVTVTWITKEGKIKRSNARSGITPTTKIKGYNPERHILLHGRKPGSRVFNQPLLVSRKMIIDIRADGLKLQIGNTPYAKLIET